MNKYTMLFVSITIFLGGLVSGILIDPNSFAKEMFSRIGVGPLASVQAKSNVSNRFAFHRRPASDLFELLALLRAQDGEDPPMGIAGGILNRKIPALERVQLAGNRTQRIHARQTLADIASEFLSPRQNTSKSDAAEIFDPESLEILSRYKNAPERLAP